MTSSLTDLLLSGDGGIWEYGNEIMAGCSSCLGFKAALFRNSRTWLFTPRGVGSVAGFSFVLFALFSLRFFLNLILLMGNMMRKLLSVQSHRGGCTMTPQQCRKVTFTQTRHSSISILCYFILRFTSWNENNKLMKACSLWSQRFHPAASYHIVV